MLFSATMPGPIVALARRFMTQPIHIRATDPDEGLTQANIKHLVYRAHSLDKDEVIARILQAEGRGKTVIFTRTKRAAPKLVEELSDRGFNAGAVHGDMSQEARERAMAAFKAGKKDVLIATDVAARGIDVDDVTHVINHTIPDDDKTYLHRVGRTGRAGKTGIAVTFVDWDDLPRWVDRSQSMLGRPFANALSAARTFVGSAGPHDHVGIVAFGHSAFGLGRFSAPPSDARTSLSGLSVDNKSGTALYDAIVLAASHLASDDSPGRAIVVVTDGADVSSSNTLEQAVAAARAAHAAVYAIGIGGPSFTPDALRTLSRETGGSYRQVARTRDLDTVYSALAAELDRTWQLSYVTASRPGMTLRLAATVHRRRIGSRSRPGGRRRGCADRALEPHPFGRLQRRRHAPRRPHGRAARAPRVRLLVCVAARRQTALADRAAPRSRRSRPQSAAPARSRLGTRARCERRRKHPREPESVPARPAHDRACRPSAARRRAPRSLRRGGVRVRAGERGECIADARDPRSDGSRRLGAVCVRLLQGEVAHQEVREPAA